MRFLLFVVLTITTGLRSGRRATDYYTTQGWSDDFIKDFGGCNGHYWHMMHTNGTSSRRGQSALVGIRGPEHDGKNYGNGNVSNGNGYIPAPMENFWVSHPVEKATALSNSIVMEDVPACWEPLCVMPFGFSRLGDFKTLAASQNTGTAQMRWQNCRTFCSNQKAGSTATWHAHCMSLEVGGYDFDDPTASSDCNCHNSGREDSDTRRTNTVGFNGMSTSTARYWYSMRWTCCVRRKPSGQLYRYNDNKPPEDASLIDDPEFKTMSGRTLKVYSSGVFRLIKIPRVGPPLLSVNAFIKPLFGSLCETYTTRVALTGGLMGASGEVQVRAASRNHPAGVMIDHGNWQGFEEFSVDRLAQSMKRPFHIEARTNAVMIAIGPIKVKFVRPHEARGADWRWLNLFFHGLEQMKLPVGGILGMDPPPAESTIPCGE